MLVVGRLGYYEFCKTQNVLWRMNAIQRRNLFLFYSFNESKSNEKKVTMKQNNFVI